MVSVSSLVTSPTVLSERSTYLGSVERDSWILSSAAALT